jgi:hypothetical protein
VSVDVLALYFCYSLTSSLFSAFMVDSLLMHVSLFPQQVWQFLQTLGQKVLAAIVAILMPLGFWLGLHIGRNATGSQGNLEPLTNLIYLELPAEGYEEVRPADGGDRRGAMQEGRRGRCVELLIDAAIASGGSVLLPDQSFQPFQSFQPLPLQPSPPDCYTTLPNGIIYLFRSEIELRPLWMYGRVDA